MKPNNKNDDNQELFPLFKQNDFKDNRRQKQLGSDRRKWILSQLAPLAATTTTTIFHNPNMAWAQQDGDTTTATEMFDNQQEQEETAIVVDAPPPKPVNTVEMKTFVDPKGLFALSLPKRYFTLRRTAKGDLPDASTGKGRRGSSIFSAGDLSKVQVLAIERFPIRALLEESGLSSSDDVTITQFDQITSNPRDMANLVNARREMELKKNSNVRTSSEVLSAAYNNDKETLYFKLRSEIEVQKPELMMETYGVNRLFRVTLGKATLQSHDGNMMAIFCSALETDYNGPDGIALEETVESFIATTPTT